MDNMAIARNLKGKMNEWQVTEKSVAAMMGVTERCVNNWINGRRQPTAYAVLRLSRLFNCTMEDLMDGVSED